MNTDTTTTVAILDQLGQIERHDITPVIGEFNPNLFCYLDDIQEVSMKKATAFNANDFVEALSFIKNLKLLAIDGCTQFHEYHIGKIIESNVNIQHIEISNCTKLSFESVHFLLGTLKNLNFLSFDPKHPQMKRQWKELLTIFRNRNVKFAGNIAKILEL